MTMRFASPLAFLLLLALPGILWLRSRRRPGSLRFSSLGNARQAGSSPRRRLAQVPLWLRIAAVVLLVLALARPQMGREKVRDVTKGIAIQMVLDRSGSMKAEMDYGGRRLNRLEAVKKVFEEFLLGNGGDLGGRPNDLVGMVAFARYADTMAPLTLGHGALLRFLDGVRIVARRNEDGTAVGDAVALAAARLRTAEEDLERMAEESGEREYEIKSKIIILLTDGQNNFGKRTPDEAADLAARWGIKVYTIGVGAGEGVSTMQTLLGAFKVPSGGGVDTATLQRIAERTGGVFRLAEDEASLREIYREIDRLEKSEIESVRYVDYQELFAPFALAGFILLLLEVLLGATFFRRLP
ncbi:MAG: VWA domain-containing protein [Candidatus Krumholzibacteriota bacterium]|nr:VWA domain-containing protein [Candidatus Krumholzibacteriota bacterium]